MLTSLSIPGPADAFSLTVGGGIALIGFVFWAPGVYVAARRRLRLHRARNLSSRLGLTDPGTSCPTSPAGAR